VVLRAAEWVVCTVKQPLNYTGIKKLNFTNVMKWILAVRI